MFSLRYTLVNKLDKLIIIANVVTEEVTRHFYQ